MLREYNREIRNAWLLWDTAICAALFLFLASLERFHAPGGLGDMDALALAGIGVCVGLGWQVLLSRFGAYESQRRKSLGDMIYRLAGADLAGAALLAAAIFTSGIPAAPAFPFALAGAIFVAQALTRIPVFHYLQNVRQQGKNYRNILIVGAGPRALEASETISRHPEWGLRILGFLDDGDPNFRPVVPSEKVHKFIDLPQILRDNTVDELLVACPRTILASLTPLVRECAMVGVPVTLLTDLFGDQLPAPRVGKFDNLGTLSFAPVHHNEFELMLKRGLDMTGAIVGLALSSVLVAGAAIAIRLTSKGPIFFRQVRVGLNGRRFEMLKLRTMEVGAEARKADLMHLNEMDGPVFKIANDPRITPVGGILRRLSIDELPQFWNVLKGEMSLVGPRPPTPDEVMLYQGDTRRRLSMRPGLTCLWQVSGRNDVSFSEWIALDLMYIDHWSLGRDFIILLRTIPEVLFARGAH